MNVKNINVRQYVINHPLFQFAVFAAFAMTAGVTSMAYAEKYANELIKYQVLLHEGKGSHIEQRVDYFTTMISQIDLRDSLIDTEIRDWEARLLTRQANDSGGVNNAEIIRLYKKYIEDLQKSHEKLMSERKEASRQRDIYRDRIANRPVPEKP